MKVTGILSISNGYSLHYPYPVVVANLHKLCDDVIVGVDPQFPVDRKTLEALNFSNVSIIDSVWNLQNRDSGSEIALQMDKLVNLAQEAGSDWVVVMQADELLHEQDFPMLRAFMERYSETSTHGFSMERIYFWKDLNTVRVDWAANLVRIFKPGTHSFMADGTDKAGMFSAAVQPGIEVKLPYKIYHYSRVDNPEVISRRVRNLDGFFHADETLVPFEDLPEYDFVPRKYDNFSTHESPEEVEGVFEAFTGNHPFGVEEWYSD